MKLTLLCVAVEAADVLLLAGVWSLRPPVLNIILLIAADTLPDWPILTTSFKSS